MTIRYFRRVEERINKSAWLIEQKSVLTEYDEDADVGFIGGRIQFKDGSVFHFKEILLGENRHYRFHYMDEGNNLISRWDSAPHHRELKTFPYHVHLPDGVKDCESVSLIGVLDKIETIVIDRLETS
ncbi:MAG: DUF6516 family protein [Deltaproteobacteria bacterium]|nr:DUF6516 family protein [Deltaproteobacteria bacterium]